MKIQIPNRSYQYISENSSECDTNCAFVLTKLNEKYLEDAKQRGAKVISINDVQEVFGLDKIKIIGITGTNGKTTTAAAIYSLLLDLDCKVAMQGTRGFFINEEKVEGKSLTTPTLLNTYTHIYQAVALGCEYFVMEVSSHAIVQERIEGLGFDLKIHTNITSDHLDYHKTLEEYIRVKNSFFADESLKLINKDDEHVDFNIKNANTYAIEGTGTFKIEAYSLNDGVSGVIRYANEVGTFNSNLYGFFNLYNITAAISAVKLLTKAPLEKICDALEHFLGVSGRMEVVEKSPLVIVDFAHTADGMEQVLDSLKEKEIVLVFGAGGDRDRSKRAPMGAVACKYAKKDFCY